MTVSLMEVRNMPRAAGPILVALVAVLVIAPSAMAAKADRYTETSTQLWCGALESDAGTAYATAWLSDRGETYADLGFWAAPATRETSAMTWAGWSNETRMSDDGSTLEITFGVYGFDEGDVDDPSDLVFIGDGTLTALLTPTGDAETFGGNDQYGNHHFRSSRSFQSYAVTGRLDLPTGISFDLAGCEAFRMTDECSATSRPSRSRTRASSTCRAAGQPRTGTSVSSHPKRRSGQERTCGSRPPTTSSTVQGR